MENATKALTMAGGVLIAIMVLATLLYAATTWGIIPTTKDKTDAAKQLAKFNQEYESYDRDALYGTDLVSVLNKAIDNNKKYDLETTEKMYIGIAFHLNNPIKKSKVTYKTYYTGEKKNQTVKGEPEYSDVEALSAGDHSLLSDRLEIENFIKKFYDVGSYRKKSDSRKGEDEYGKYTYYTVEIPDVSEFKTRVFKCVFVNRDDDGRITHMRFVEVDTNQK